MSRVAGDDGAAGMDARRDRQLEQERERGGRFRSRHARLNRMPIVGPLARALYSQQLSRLLALAVILLVYTGLKAPHLDRSFTGGHSLKYNSYVEPAMYMAEYNDPLRYQLPYQSDPEWSPDGRMPRFSHLPLMEWGLYLTYELLPFTIELETRLFTHLIGLCVLVLCYFFFRRWVPNELALFTVLLAALNPIVAFATYVTVLDSLLIGWMFGSLLLLSRYLEHRRLKHLYLAGIAGGIGVAIKLSIFLWLVPIAGVLLVMDHVSIARRLTTCILFGATAVLPLVAARTSISMLPSAPLTGGLLTVAWIAGFVVLYFIFARRDETISTVIRRAGRTPWIGWTTVAAVVAIGVFVFFRLRLDRFAPQFLTDANLLFEPRLYLYMAGEQFREYMTPPVTYLAGAGGLVLLLTRGSGAKRVFLALLAGCLVYWIVASKAMFIHNYYTMILMITGAFAGAALLYLILLRLRGQSERAIMGLLLVAVFLRPAQRAATDLLAKEEDISALVEFVRENTVPGDLLLHEGYYSALGIYTRRGLVRAMRLATPAFRQDIEAEGFGSAMRKRGIKYLVTPFEHPTYLDFAPVFEETSVKAPTYHRSYRICRSLSLDCPELASQFDELGRMVAERNIRSAFRMEAQVGKFNIYSFQDTADERP